MTPLACHHPSTSRPAWSMRTGSATRDAGSAAIELAIAAPALIGLLLLVIAAGRISAANAAIDDAAISASRSASIARTTETARADAHAAARAVLNQQGISCAGGPVIEVNLGGFSTRPGQTAQVSVRVRCTVKLAPMPGTRTATSTSVSVLDTYRERRSR